MQAQGVGVEPIPVAAEKGGEKESGGEGGAGDEGTILIDLYDYGSKAKIGIQALVELGEGKVILSTNTVLLE